MHPGACAEGISSSRKESVHLMALNIHFPFLFEWVGPEHSAILSPAVVNISQRAAPSNRRIVFGLDVLIAAFFSVAGATRQQPLGALTASFDGCFGRLWAACFSWYFRNRNSMCHMETAEIKVRFNDRKGTLVRSLPSLELGKCKRSLLLYMPPRFTCN